MNYKLLDYSILVTTTLFFVGILAFEYPTFGLSGPLILIPPEWESFFDVLIWPLVVLLIIDLALKYKKTRNTKKFIKKYWIDIVMLVLIPIFSVFKSLKVGISIVKQLKTAKMGAKIAHKSKKISKK